MDGWSLFPHFIVRTTGFPWEMLGRLRCARAGEWARRWSRERAAMQALRRDAPRIHRPPKPVLAALKAERPVPLDQVEDPALFTEWNRVARALAAAQAEFERTFEEEQALAAAALREIMEDLRVREAVASSSPSVHTDLSRGRWSARLERQAASYVQRLCAKNETMSFFGPINYGWCDEHAPDGVTLHWSGPQVLTGRRPHVASWLVQGMVRRIAFDPEVAPWLVLRRKGFAEPPLPRSRPAEGVTQKEGTEGGELLARLVRAADGAKSLQALSEELGTPLPALLEAARFACEKSLLTHQLELPSASPLPLADLVERLSGIPGPGARAHVASLAEVLGRMERYGAADADTKVKLNEELRQFVEARWQVRASNTGKPEEGREEAKASAAGPARSESNFYVDRLPIREECRGDLRLVLGGERAAELPRRLSRSLELLGQAAESTRQRARARVAALMGKRRVSFLKVVAAFSQEPIPYDESVSQAIASAIPDPSAARCGVDPARLSGAPPSGELPLICSVDLLIGAPDAESWARGEYEIVMGDIHDTALVWGWALQFHERRAEVESAMLRVMGALARPMPVVTVLASRRTGLLPSEFPGPVIELGGVSARPSAWRLPFDDLFVISDGERAHLWSQSLRSEVCLYNGEMETLVHTAFALPRIRPPRVDLGAHTPRLMVEEVILQREQWRLSPEEVEALLACKDDRARLTTAARIWGARGLPEYVFAKLPGERKPVLVDPCSPFILRSFINILQHRGGAILSEMFPAPSQLWLSSGGGRHTAELRCTFLRGGKQ